MLISTENTEDFWAKLLSLPSWERGLKPPHIILKLKLHKSLPSWERGLKQMDGQMNEPLTESLPSWERGLKLHQICNHEIFFSVAPLVGAWIETVTPGDVIEIQGRSPRGSVD